MGKSFVLRDETGLAIGYLQQVGNALRCGVRLHEREGSCELFILKADETLEKKHLSAGQSEYEWDGIWQSVSGGVIVSGGMILADTGSEAKNRIRRILQKNTSVTRANEAEPESFFHKENCCEQQPIHLKRWPSNPCILK